MVGEGLFRKNITLESKLVVLENNLKVGGAWFPYDKIACDCFDSRQRLHVIFCNNVVTSNNSKHN